MRKHYTDTLNEHLRITILRFLEEEADYRLNESMLLDLTETYAFDRDRDRLRVQLSWLANQGMVELAEVNGLYVVQLTDRGADVARGGVRVPGIKRPGPGGC